MKVAITNSSRPIHQIVARSGELEDKSNMEVSMYEIWEVEQLIRKGLPMYELTDKQVMIYREFLK